MAHIVLTLAEWRAVAHELRGAHHAGAPAGLNERLQAFIQDTPRDWQDQPYAIDLDATSIEAVWAVHASVTTSRPATNDQHASVLAAMQIIYLHQQPADGFTLDSQDHP
jgi:hypothetical protein